MKNIHFFVGKKWGDVKEVLKKYIVINNEMIDERIAFTKNGEDYYEATIDFDLKEIDDVKNEEFYIKINGYIVETDKELYTLIDDKEIITRI